jgi:phosphocarrier protein
MGGNVVRSFKYVINDEVGLHARPAGLLVNEAKKYASKIILEAKGKSVEATRLMMILGLGIKQGNEVTVKIEGEDEELASEKLENFFQKNL